MSERDRSHLVPLGDTGWRLWRDVVVRGTGFPARDVLQLADPELAAAADRVTSGGDRGAYDSAYAAAGPRLSAAVRRVAAEPLFREAVIWQNRRLVAECLDKAAAGEPRNVRGRNHETTIASYLQRYCLKNDTIGFFGPVGWAHWTQGTEFAEVSPGPGLTARRTVYFETWAIDALAQTFSDRADVQPWLAPRLIAAHRLDGRLIHQPGRPAVALTEPEAQILALCDGTRTIREIAAELLWSEYPELGDEAELLDIVLDLRTRALLTLDLTGPIEAFPERTLRRRLALIGDPPVRDRAVAVLDDIVTARDAVAAAAGDPQQLTVAFDRLNELFHAATGAAGERRAGQTYAGRTLVYEDTVRDSEVRLGAPLRDKIAPALGLLLDSARWLVAEVGAEYHRLFLEFYERRHSATGDPVVPLGTVLGPATPYLFFSLRELPAPVLTAVDEFQRRWAKILRTPLDQRRHTTTSADIRQGVEDAFPRVVLPWATAAHHAPDLMLTGTGEQDLAVLGELHLSFNSLESRVFVEQHHDPEQLLRMAAADLGDRRIYALPPKEWPAVTSRLSPPSALLSPSYTYWAPHTDAVAPPGPVLPSADLFVHRRGDTLVVRSGDGSFEADLLEVVGEFMSAAVVNAFKPFAPAPHRPRITIDQLVVARESWSFPAADVSWAFVKDERERFLAARSWRTEHDLPEHAFVKVPVEDKPTFVDFSSLVFVNIMAKSVRRTAERPGGTVSLTEMLPGLSETWLIDSAGQGYLSELRILAVDPLTERM